jgi:hypothetical protein
MKNIILFVVLLSLAMAAEGQENKWHELEGVYQSSANKEMYVRFTAGDSMLTAHLLWNNGEIHLRPDTGLAFVSKEAEDGNPIHVVFQRDPSGSVNRASVANNGIWVRAPNYKPVAKSEMPHTADQLQKFVGLYQLKGEASQFIQLTVDNNSLTLHQHWDGGIRDHFVPESEWNFFEPQFPIFTLNFSLDQEGRVTQFTAFGRDVWIRTAKASLSPAVVKKYEGKYRSSDDPDNMVQVVAAGNELIVRELWNKKEIRLQALTNTYFSDSRLSFPLQIILDDKGQAKQLVLLGNQTFVRIE